MDFVDKAYAEICDHSLYRSTGGRCSHNKLATLVPSILVYPSLYFVFHILTMINSFKVGVNPSYFRFFFFTKPKNSVFFNSRHENFPFLNGTPFFSDPNLWSPSSM